MEDDTQARLLDQWERGWAALFQALRGLSAADLTRAVALLFIGAVIALTLCLVVFLREISIAAVSARQTVGPQFLERSQSTAKVK